MFELQYFIIGIVQGFTEFLPISSSGHLVLVSQLTSWQDQGLFTDVAVHVGTLLAVIIYLRSHITSLIMSFFTFHLNQNNNLIKIVIATIDLCMAKILSVILPLLLNVLNLSI